MSFDWIGQEKAADKNLQGTNKTNKLNKQMFDESRGSGGSAVMPLYLKGRGGGLFENELGADMVNDYYKSRADAPDFKSVSSDYEPMVAASRKAASGIFDGGVEREMTDHFAPVKTARVAFRRQAAVDALSKTLADIDAAQANKGFTGDSAGSRLLRFQAEKGAATDVAGANLQNLEEQRGISDAALNLKLGNLGLPYQMSREEMAFQQAPHDAEIDSIMKGLTPLSFLRIGGSQPFQYQAPPLRTGSGAWGGASAAVNTGVGTALNMWLKQRQAQQYAQTGPYSNSGGGGYGSGGNTQPADYENAAYGNGGSGYGGADWGGEMGDWSGSDWGGEMSI
jgi:hypothetical protein